jgi:mannosyltransferase
MVYIDGIIFSLQARGGISTYFRELLAHLSAQQQAFTLGLETPLQAVVDLPRIERDARLLERYRRARLGALGGGQPAVFHSSYYRQPARKATPTVVTVHDFVYERYYHGPKRWVHAAQKHAAIRQAQAIICISEATREDLLTFVGVKPGQHVHVIHNAASTLFHPLPASQTDEDEPFVLYVGQRSGYKNFDLLLRAMLHLPDLRLKCVGGGALTAHELAAAPSSVRERVSHAGAVDDEALNAMYNRAECLVYPSAYEGFGIPVIEAMQAGCPVVSIDCAAVLEVGQGALSVAEQADPNALALAIERTMSRSRQQYVNRGLQVASRYSWANTHERTVQVYQSLMA